MKKFATKDIISIVLPAVAVLSCYVFVFWLADVFGTEKPMPAMLWYPDDWFKPFAVVDFLGGAIWIGAFYSIPGFKKWRPHHVLRNGTRIWGSSFLPTNKSAWAGYCLAFVTWTAFCLLWSAPLADTAPWWLNQYVTTFGALCGTIYWPAYWAWKKQKLEVSQ